MSDGLGYHQQVEGGIYGQPDGPDPAIILAQQEASFARMLAIKEATARTTYVPPSYVGQTGASYEGQVGGPSNLPYIGATSQNTKGPLILPPDKFTAKDMGRIPDWTNVANAGGAYDQNQVGYTGEAPNPLNRAPIGETYFDGMMGQPPNPNVLPEDVSGTIDLEW